VGDESQTVNAGGGNDRIIVSATTVGALVNGGLGTNTLEIVGGGTAVMNANDTCINVVQLDDATDVTLNNLSLTVTGSSGNDTIIIGTGNSTLSGGGGDDHYVFGETFGQDIINNGSLDGNTLAHGVIDFLSGVDYEDLWFKQSANNLEIDLLGTTQTITVTNWYGGSEDAQVEGIYVDGLLIDSQIEQLVSAMAAYESSHSGFDVTTAAAMPGDTDLQTALASSWHA